MVKTAPDHTRTRKEPPITKPCKFTPSDVSARRTNGLYADFVAQPAENGQVSIEGMKPTTLRAGLRRALKGNDDVKMAQRGEHTCLVRQAAK